MDEFAAFLTEHPEIAAELRAAATAAPNQFGFVSEAALVALMFPVVRWVLVQIGLPWLYEARRYSELHRRRLHQWIDESYQELGIDPDRAEQASNRLINRLEKTTDLGVRQAWERLRELLMKPGGKRP